MERIIRIIRSFMLVSTFIFSASPGAYAQKVTKLHDKSKLYQLRSMENGKWEFHPGSYYLLWHKSYSGGYWKGLNIKWSESKSSVGRIEPTRALEVAEESLSAHNVELQIDSISPIFTEETIRSTERSVDLIYMQYETKFKDAFAAIDEFTKIANTKSYGELLQETLCIIDEKELLQAEIDYIHEYGPTKQMEQAKRQLAYEEVLKKLENLCKRSYKLASYAYTLNNLNK